MNRFHRHLKLPRATALVAALGLTVAASALAEKEIGRVVAVRGTVTAKAPGEGARALQCNDPIFAGDEIEVSEKGGLGVLSGGVYAGMGEKTDLELETTDAGAPRLDVKHGHVRVLDAEAGSGSARILTPGLLAYDAGSDTEALVFPEKAWTVSMVCAYDDPVQVTRAAKGDGTRAAPGTCAIDKPRESLFTSPATHPRLAVIDDDCGGAGLIPVAGSAADHFGSPADVAAGPDVAASAFGSPSLAPAVAGVAGANSLRNSCDAGTCGGNTPGPVPGPPFGNTPSPFIPPTN
ncbi:MAG: hypothetical protein ACQGVK_20910 [Myxococcota bacterium]